MMTSIKYATIAELYDTYVQTTLDIPFFLEEVGKTTGEVLELMSGTGRVSIPLIEAGTRLTCVDKSPEMLAILRQKLVGRRLFAQVHQMDIRQLDLHRTFDLVIIPFHSFAEITLSSDQRAVLSAVYAHMSKAGRFICTLHNPPIRLKSVDGQLRLWQKYGLDGDSGMLLLLGLENYDQNSRIVNGLQFFEEYSADGTMGSKRVLETYFALLEKSEFEKMAHSAGFEVVSLYGDYSYSTFQEESSPFMIWTLGKRQ